MKKAIYKPHASYEAETSFAMAITTAIIVMLSLV